MKWFFDSLIEEEKKIKDILASPIAMIPLTAKQANEYSTAESCHICTEPLGADKVRDHDHLTGEYRGAAHNQCNLLFRYHTENQRKLQSFIIPVVFHNLRGYDSHLLLSEFGKHKNRRLFCIANNSEKFMTLSSNGLRFIDSMQFMASSLEKLVENLKCTGVSAFKNLNRLFPNDNQRNLLLRKGVYPYDYITTEEKFADGQLPPIEAFYSELSESCISEEDYRHAQCVWTAWSMKTLGDYHDLYMLADVVQLADVFENFRKTSMSTYGLDPAHYLTAPGLSWDAMLK